MCFNGIILKVLNCENPILIMTLFTSMRAIHLWMLRIDQKVQEKSLDGRMKSA